jgi:hypothetical protein
MVRGWLASAFLLAGALTFAWLGLVSVSEAQDEAVGAAGNAPEEVRDEAPEEPLSEALMSRLVDAELAKVWEREAIQPTTLTSDAEFLRRVFLDLLGVPPTPEEVRAFLKPGQSDAVRRAELIDRLLLDPRQARHLADLWTNILMGRSGRDFGGSTHIFAVWLAKQFERNVSFSKVIYDIITAEGRLSENPAVAVWARTLPYNIADAAGTLSKNLTGVQIQCAECHDHMYEPALTQEVFFGVASFFSGVTVRVNNRSLPVDPVVRDVPEVPRIPANFERLPAQARERVEQALRYSRPVTLDGDVLLTRDRTFWRPALARWMTSDENLQTARYVVNRHWAFLFGMGLVNPVDDFHSLNEPSHPELLDALARDLIAHGYDLRRLYRILLNSRAYQLSSAGRDDKAENWHFAAAQVRQLTPEQFFASLLQVGSAGDLARTYRNRANPADALRRNFERRLREMREREEDSPRPVFEFDDQALARLTAQLSKLDDGWFMRRGLAQAYARASSDDEMTESDGFTLTIDQALAVLNGDLTNRIAGSGRGSMLGDVMRAERDPAARLERVILTVLARMPSGEESQRLLAYVEEQGGSNAAWEDVVFALLSTTEFATNH